MRACHIRLGGTTRLILAGVLAAGIVGCNDPKGGVQRLQPRSAPYLEGIPVPSGFDLIETQTMDYESGGQRTARHRYRGFADAHAVREFYREQMPLLGWTRVSDQSARGNVAIRFERPKEAATVEIDAGWMNITTIEVSVYPFTRTPSEPPRRPTP